MAGPGEPTERGRTRRASVLAALEADPGLLYDELVAATGLELRRLAPLLWRMEDERLVVHEGRRWFVAP